MKRYVALICLVLLLPTMGLAATYKWVDDKGVVGFADDLGKVPPRYRSKAVIVDDTAQPVEIVETSRQAVSDGDKEKDAKGALTTGKQEKKKVVYGGKDEAVWNREFAKLKADIKANEEHLAELKGRLADTGKMSRNEYLALQNSVKDTELRMSVLRQKLQALQEDADKASVPNDIR